MPIERKGYNVLIPRESRIKDEHILPTVRIQKITIENFKCVKHGDVIFNCGRKVIPAGTYSDILGVYGQNGSGKTSLIEALGILKYALTGKRVPERFAKCVDVEADSAFLEFTFDFQYPEPMNITRTIVYSFNIKSVSNEAVEDDNEYEVAHKKANPLKIKIYNERISAAGVFDDCEQKMQPIFTTDDGSGYAFGPTRKVSEYIGENKDKNAFELEIIKREASRASRSFIFSEEALDIFTGNEPFSEYLKILLELNYFGLRYLYVIDRRGSSSDSAFIPFNSRMGVITFKFKRPSYVPRLMFQFLTHYANQINIVLAQIIPGMQLVFKDAGILPEGLPESEDLVAVALYSKRGDIEIPLHYESEGIIKLVGLLSLIISSFNDKSCTIAIDELDAGIYEYLLGEILIVYEEYGKGQMIFTSHNLRPLEVLKKEHLVFTTSNPENRYIRLKGVGKTNNLRNLYFKEITDCSQDEEIYSAAKRYKLVAAFQKAGDWYA